MAEQFLDITKQHCPMTFVKTKLKLNQMAIGEVLDVLLTSGEPLDNMPENLRDHGHEVISLEPEGEFFRLRVKKLVA
jgi:TusA-related sulfurtransferase